MRTTGAGPPVVVGLLAAAVAFGAVTALDGDAGAPVRTAANPQPPSTVTAGRAVFARMGCGNCHRLAAANAHGTMGPDLDERLASHDRGSLTRKIVAPYRGAPSGTFPLMPTDFGRRLTSGELAELVSFLWWARRAPPD